MLSPEQAVALAAVRGKEMAAACAVEPTSMAALLGGDADTVLAALAEHELEPANRNGTGQVVAAGRTSDIEALAAEPPGGCPGAAPGRGRRLPHPLHGARREGALPPGSPSTVTSSPPPTRCSRCSPTPTAPSSARDRTCSTGSSRRSRSRSAGTPAWTPSRERGITGAVELTPAGTLTGMVKRQIKGTATANVSTPDDLAAAVELIRGGA